MELHKRLAHVNFYTIERLVDLNLVDGFWSQSLRQFNKIDCVDCIQSKITRSSFPSSVERRTNRPGEVTHTDVWGPAPYIWIGGIRYFISCNDDYSRFVTLGFVKYRTKIVVKFKAYVAERMEWMRSNNAKEIIEGPSSSYL